jgi:replicative DNA helicase
MIERNILGLVLTGNLDPLITGLDEKHFSNFAHKKIWSCIQDISARKETPDLITVTDKMNILDTSEDWFVHLSVIANENIGSFSAKGHITQIKKQWKIREIKNIGAEMANDDLADVNKYIKTLMELDTTEKKYLHTFTEAAEDALCEIEKVMAGESVTVPTGLSDIDKVMGGLHKSDFIVVAARPAMGKTAFMLNMAAANKNNPLVFSTEQSRIQAASRFFSIHGNIPNHLIRTGDIGDTEWGQITEAVRIINESDGFIYDKSGPYMHEIESTARDVYHNHGCSAIYLDYLQRIKHENPRLPKHEQVGDIAMRLKELARELDIPVVALAQVSRKVESREDKRPLMGDIKDSGTIEQEADSILTLYRDEVYDEGSPDKGTCEVNFKKNRHGGTGLVRVQWSAPTMRFNDLTPMNY